ncbi:Protein CBG04697 [Caenorhabditis briggsae]|uniref:Protein CBG04697 n=1 Tax=Caenorhabditis briggsae TaxID=6238 RepID=A8WY92_CAEBR|nr:Protein CBG04697 [Caenorhabditis briggsae]CAP25350.1 Protein CBG04697 [Caenorhabditis briggsae]
MCSSKVAIALIASLAFSSALPILDGIIGGGDNGGIGGVVGGGDGGLGGIIGGGNGGGIGGIVGDLLGGDQDVLQNLLSVLGGNPGGLGLPILGNITEIPSFLSHILGDLPEETIQKITDLLGEDHPISELLSRLDALLPEGVLEEIDTIFYIASQVEKTLQGGSGGVVPELPEVPSVPETPQVPV